MSGIDKDIVKKFGDFLRKGGAEILDTTNPWEIARFKTVHGICVVYQSAKGKVSYSSEHAHNAFSAWQENRKWTASLTSERIKRKTVEELLVERDGPTCFYCGTANFSDTDGKPTLEHILSISDGGNNHLANLALACEPCNRQVASLPIVEKIKYRFMKRTGQNL